MPAAAVIPAPRAYINVVAVKKPVVGFEDASCIRTCVKGFWIVGTSTLRRYPDICGIVHWPKLP